MKDLDHFCTCSTQGTTGWLQCTGTLVVAKWQPGATIVNVTALARMTTMVVVKEIIPVMAFIYRDQDDDVPAHMTTERE